MSGHSRLIVGGAIWSRSARTVKPASRLPAPPRRWPAMDLVEPPASSGPLSRKWLHGRLGGPADDGIGVGVVNDSVGFPDGVRSGGACRSRRQVRSGSSPTNRDLSSSQIDDRRRDKEWGNTPRALARELRMFALDGLETSNATSHENSDAVRMFRLHIETSMSNCELGGG